MKYSKLTKEDKELIKKAKEIIMHARVTKKQLLTEVRSVLISGEGKLYSGVNMTLTATSSAGNTCGEQGAISNLLADGGKKINVIVAVWVSKSYKKNKQWDVIQPCGSCRHVISHFGNPWVIVSRTKKVKLNELYPLPVK